MRTLVAGSIAILCRIPLGAAEAPPPALDIRSPVKGAKIESGVVEFFAQLRNAPAEKLLLRLAVAGKSSAGPRHCILVDPDDPWTAPARVLNVFEDLLLLTAGAHELAVELAGVETGKVLLSDKIPFSVAGPPPAAIDRYRAEAALSLANGARWLRQAEDDYARELVRQKADGAAYGGDAKGAAARYLMYVNLDFFQRMQGYAILASHYDRSWQQADALACLNLAEEILQKEKERTVVAAPFGAWPIVRSPEGVSKAPSHYEGYARFYARRGDLAPAVEWLLKEAAWYEQQATAAPPSQGQTTEARKLEAESYRKIAHLHVMLASDLDGYAKHIARFKAMLPESARNANYSSFGPVMRAF
ncbi:MAG TPA: hypothetical protein DCM87_12060 [Planctomycetes bacterium]|nr:hypothetical protein [Planctomycetota bacterium]